MTDRPNDIPQDVWDAVQDPATEAFDAGVDLYETGVESASIRVIIGRAILADRATRPAAVEDGPGEWRPTLIRNEAAGFTEFVTEDVPALYGPMEARNVEVVMRLQGPRGDVLGYRIYDPSPTEGEAR